MMEEGYHRGFGLLIAFVLPGFMFLVGISIWVPAVETWLALQPHATASVGSFLHLLLASIAAGLSVSAVRWAIVDTLHHHTGLPAPDLNFSKLEGRLSAYLLSVEFTYRYYQFYANMLVVLPVCWLSWRGSGNVPRGVGDLIAVFLECVFAAASRHCLRRYYARLRQLLGTGRKN